MKQVYYSLLIMAFIWIVSCTTTRPIPSATSISDCNCDSLWSKPAAKEFVTLLEKTTLTNHPMWKGFNLGDAAFVLNAGSVNDSTHCLCLWKKGKPVSYTCSGDIPDMLTPLYSYYLNYKNARKIDSTYFDTYKNAPEFS